MLLICSDLSFTYPNASFQALKHVSFTVENGDYLALLGPNGSGKSTLARLIAGFLTPTAGKIDFDNSNDFSGIVFQSPKDQIVAGIVKRDTSFGPENLNLSPEEISERVKTNLEITGLTPKSESSTLSLSLGQTQKMALAGILALNPKLLILDESLSMIDPASRIDILNYLDELNKKGITIIHVTHDTDEALRAKHILALDDGSIYFQGTPQDLLHNKEKEINLFGEPLMRRKKDVKKSEVVFKLQNINFSYDNKLFSDFSLSLNKGTLTAIVGPSGSGKSTLFEISNGLLKAQSGKIFSTCRPLLALQDCDSALFEEFAADDVAFGAANNGLKGKELKTKVQDAMNLMGLPFEQYANRRTIQLSGGEKRKLSLAGIIAMDSDIIFFDEPTSALDPISRCSIMNTLRKLCDEGKTIFFSTHKLDEAAFADRCITLSNGKIESDVFPGFVEAPKTETQKDSPLLKELQSFEQGDTLKNLRKRTNSSYKPLKSPVHKMPAVAKYIVFLSLFIFGLCVNSNLLLGISVLSSILYAILSFCSVKLILIRILKMLPWIAFFLIFQFIFFPVLPGEKIFFELAFFSVSTSKILLAAKTLLHVVSAIICLTVFLFSTNEIEIIDGIKKMPFLSSKIAITVGIIFRFIPLLTQEAILIIKAQLIRGGLKNAKGPFGKVRTMLPVFVPLILQTLKRTEALADTLTARQLK